jgi:hypothetical protein
VGVVGVEAPGDRGPRVLDGGERLVPEFGYHPGGRVAHGAPCGGLLFGLPDLGGHDGGHVVLTERLVGVVEHDLALSGVLHDAGLEVVAHRALGHSSPVLVHVHVAAEPGPLLHVERRLKVGHLAEREHPDEEVYPRHLAGHGVDLALAQRGPGPVDLAGDAGLVLDALGEVVRSDVVAVALAEPGVAHGHLVLAGAPLAVLVVQQAQVHADLRHLPVHVVPVGLLKGALPHVAVGIEEPVDLLLRQLPHLAPADSALLGDAEDLADGVHRHVAGLRYPPSRHVLLAELHDELRTYLPCHVDRSPFV